jgi:hypothetical protein
LAQTQAWQFLAQNLASLKATQCELVSVVGQQKLDVEWVFARDRTLTAIDEGELWWSGCSLPARAAETILAKLEVRGGVGCFLAPSHSAMLRVALSKLRPEQAIIAIVPDLRDLALMLHCEDFSSELDAHRLWFAAGESWDVALRLVLDEHPGLPTPSSFIRTPDADPQVIDPLISSAQRVFSEMNAARNTAMQSMRQEIRVCPRHRVCVVAPSRFRLWNDLGPVMRSAVDGVSNLEIAAFYCDDPCNGSPLALLRAASQCGAIFTANTARTDLPGLIPESLQWITWLTTPRLPSAALSGPDDHLIVVDSILRDLAIQSGWSDRQVHVGAWPIANGLLSVDFREGPVELSIVADTSALDTPKDLIEYSSHSLLWEAIRHELLKTPFALADINGYLDDRMRQIGVADENFPRARFMEKLIVPAYQQGLARLLLNARVPLRLHGQGWDRIDEFRPLAHGAVESREQLHEITRSSAALVQVWPTGIAHPIDAMGVAVVGKQKSSPGFLDQANRALRGLLVAPNQSSSPLGPDLIRKILMP